MALRISDCTVPPRKYWSRYDSPYVMSLAEELKRRSKAAEVWCTFDNTASGAAIENAWELRQRVSEDSATVGGRGA